MNLRDYIESQHGGNNAAFARSEDILPQQVTRWIKEEWIVLNGKLYSPKRELKGNIMTKINQLVALIKQSNELHGCMAEDDSNERITDILSRFGLTDDEDDITDKIGLDGLQAVRDAESGIY